MVTVAIPFYNAEKYIEFAIQSVLAQTYSNWKLILLDDGSTDNSLQIAKQYERLDTRIKVYSDGKNKNLAFRLNEISLLTNTKYLFRMDADDIMHPKRIEIQIKILQEHPEIDVLGTNAYSINEKNIVEGIRQKEDIFHPKLVNCSTFIHPTIVAKTEWFRNNPYDAKAVRVEDYELWHRTIKTSTFKNYTVPLLFYREFAYDYYKKYFKGIRSLFYIANKKRNFKNYHNAIMFCGKACIYYCFNLLGIERFLIKNRYFKIDMQRKKNAQRILNSTISKN